ncbi:MAG: LuxR C-terminal-related transcriptional regulator [Dehalococcoidia bacterium]
MFTAPPCQPVDESDDLGTAIRTSAGLIFVDLTGAILVASQGALDLLGCAGPELADRRLSSFVPALHRDSIAAQLAQVLRRQTGVYETRVPFVRRDRTGIDMRLRVAAIEAEGTPLGAVALLDPVEGARPSDGAGLHAVVTPRQRQVLERLLDGVTVQHIADSLGISVNTARMHIKNMHSATETRTLHGLAIWATRHTGCCRGE